MPAFWQGACDGTDEQPATATLKDGEMEVEQGDAKTVYALNRVCLCALNASTVYVQLDAAEEDERAEPPEVSLVCADQDEASRVFDWINRHIKASHDEQAASDAEEPLLPNGKRKRSRDSE